MKYQYINDIRGLISHMYGVAGNGAIWLSRHAGLRGSTLTGTQSLIFVVSAHFCVDQCKQINKCTRTLLVIQIFPDRGVKQTIPLLQWTLDINPVCV